MTREVVTSENRDEYMKKKLGIENEKLGKVHLEHDDDISHIFHNNKKVGEIKHQNKDGMTQILRSDVDKEHQGKGIGTQAYNQFIEHHLKNGKSVGSDSMLTEEGKAVWEKLKNKFDVKESKNVRNMARGNVTTLSREDVLRLRPRTREYDSTYSSGHEPVYQIHSKKESKKVK